MIPKTLHQIWNTDAIPSVWQDYVLSWHRHHPEWQYYLWSNDERIAFVSERRPDLLPMYNRFDTKVQKADLFRYIVLSELGGVYADLDIECLRPIDRLIDGKKIVLGREPVGHGQEWGLDYVVGNALMGSEPSHPLLDELLTTIRSKRATVSATTEVLTTTGTFTLTDVYKRYPHGDVTLLDPVVFYPYGAWTPELFTLVSNGPTANDIRREALSAGSFGIHYWWGSWVDGLSGGRLVNPSPRAVDGFTFYRGVESPGFEVGCGRRNVSTLAEHARDFEHVAGFNTDGFFKSRIHPPRRWVRLRNAGRHEGLYVKNEVADALRSAASDTHSAGEALAP